MKNKWIKPICDSLEKLPDILINELISKVTKLSKKYKDTLISIDDEISKTEDQLSKLLDELNADEYDKKGLEELKKLLGGNN